jgi:hypothetical protein
MYVLHVWDILNLPRNGMLKDYAASIVEVYGPPETVLSIYTTTRFDWPRDENLILLVLVILGTNRTYDSV